MTKQETLFYAMNKMQEHGLTQKGWYFAFDNAKRRAGVCNYRKKMIAISQYLLPYMKDEAIKDTILHEIAHAIVGSGHGHNRVWQRKAIEIGCNGNRCYDPVNEFHSGSSEKLVTQSKYTLTCPNCGKTSAIHRKPKRDKSCGKCDKVYNPKYKLILTQNY